MKFDNIKVGDIVEACGSNPDGLDVWSRPTIVTSVSEEHFTVEGFNKAVLKSTGEIHGTYGCNWVRHRLRLL